MAAGTPPSGKTVRFTSTHFGNTLGRSKSNALPRQQPHLIAAYRVTEALQAAIKLVPTSDGSRGLSVADLNLALAAGAIQVLITPWGYHFVLKWNGVNDISRVVSSYSNLLIGAVDQTKLAHFDHGLFEGGSAWKRL
ncbi:hypothetical protein [Aestuariivirga sp.]|uniref:hypothetical protein n=1 Tax=Aestuariivirga sp. TaxID=2650926 RepID=UPI00391DCFC2